VLTASEHATFCVSAQNNRKYIQHKLSLTDILERSNRFYTSLDILNDRLHISSNTQASHCLRNLVQ